MLLAPGHPWSGQYSAVSALAGLGKAAVPALVRTLGEPATSYKSAEALGWIGDPLTREPLVQLVRTSPDPDVREAAGMALARIPGSLDENSLKALSVAFRREHVRTFADRCRAYAILSAIVGGVDHRNIRMVYPVLLRDAKRLGGGWGRWRHDVLASLAPVLRDASSDKEWRRWLKRIDRALWWEFRLPLMVMRTLDFWSRLRHGRRFSAS